MQLPPVRIPPTRGLEIDWRFPFDPAGVRHPDWEYDREDDGNEGFVDQDWYNERMENWETRTPKEMGVPVPFLQQLQDLNESIMNNQFFDPNDPFEPLPRADPPRKRSFNLPEWCNPEKPADLLSLFLPDWLLQTIADNTNKKAVKWWQKHKGCKPHLRYWKPCTREEIRAFYACFVWLGLHGTTDLVSNWDRPINYNSPMSKIALSRFEDIKRFWHVSDPTVKLTSEDWYKKVDPHASHLRNVSRTCMVPSQNVSFDEMVVAFKGRSKHTKKFPNKPISQGYQIEALCDSGFLIDFAFYSGAKDHGTGGVEFVNNPLEMSETQLVVLSIVLRALPFRDYEFTVVMDNRYTRYNLFHSLRKKGIGAVGTLAANYTYKHFEQEAKVANDEYKWGSVYFESYVREEKVKQKVDVPGKRKKQIVEVTVTKGGTDVAVTLWYDMKPVFFLTTIHGPTGKAPAPHFPVYPNMRRRPAATSSAPSQVTKQFDLPVTDKQRVIFEKDHDFESQDLQVAVKAFKVKANEFYTGRMLLATFCVSHFYNYGMNGCDIADQYRAYLVTQLIGVKSWQPIAFFLLDQSMINMFLIYKWTLEDKGVPSWKIKRRGFMEAVVAAMIEEPPRVDVAPLRVHRLNYTGMNWALLCYWCRVMKKPAKQVKRVYTKCFACDKNLCEECHFIYHHHFGLAVKELS